MIKPFIIDYVEMDGEAFPLMTEETINATKAYVEDRQKEKTKLEEGDFKSEAMGVSFEIELANQNLENDRALRERFKDDIKSALFEMRLPVAGDRFYIQDLNITDPLKLLRACYERLKPSLKVSTDGTDEPFDILPFLETLSIACKNAIFCNVSEKQRFLLMKLRG